MSRTALALATRLLFLTSVLPGQEPRLEVVSCAAARKDQLSGGNG